MNVCNNCKQEIKENQMFCGYCGTKIQSNINSSSIINNNIVNVQTVKKQPQIIDATNDSLINNINDNNKKLQPKKVKKKKYRFLIFLMILVIIFLLFKGINAYRKTLDKIYITSRDIIEKKDNTNFYKIDKKIKELKLKIKTNEKVRNTKIKLSSYNLVLYEEEYTDNKKWTIKDVSLPIGESNLEVKVTLENDETIERKITLYNTTENNLGKLDTKDTDNDKLLNYQEEIYNTNKLLSDSDEDGLTDYEELVYTNTDPSKYSTYKEGISDANDDYDGDGLSNLEELQLGTNVLESDTDGDGLTDYEEVKNYNTDYKKQDTDNDGVSDYDEVKNYNTNPLSKTEEFSGKLESENREVGITLNNISLEDINNTKFKESGLSILSDKMAGYIMPAYDISTNVPFTSSEITFNFEDYELAEGAIPTIYYYNENTKFLEELPTTVVGKTATTTVTHFSTYILVDKNLYSQINQINSNSTQIEIVEKINGEYIFFISPIAAKFAGIPLQILTSPDITDKQAEQIKEEIRLNLELDYQIEIKRIKSKIGFDIMKDFYNIVYEALHTFMVSLELGDLFTTINISDNSYYHNIAETLLIGYIQNTKDLGSFLTEGNNTNVFEDNKVLIDLEDENDSNEDGISDNYTIAILNGSIKTSTGINPFEGYTLEQINENDDLDKDGLKNGDEIKVSQNSEGNLYIEIISEPTNKDSDFDGLNDKEDSTPLESNTPGFTVSGKLTDNIDISNLEKEVKEYNSLFGTGKKVGNLFQYIEYEKDGEIKSSPYSELTLQSGELIYMGVTVFAAYGSLTGELGNVGDAGKAWSRYFEKSATTYTEKDLVEPSESIDSIFRSPDTDKYLNDNIQKIIAISETSINDGEKKVIKTTKPLIGTRNETIEVETETGIVEKKQNNNTFGFLHSSSSHAIAEITNKNDQYTMKLRYFIVDIYDWKNAEECNIYSNNGINKCVAEVHYFNEMLLGNAKAFLVKIEYDMEITWKKGETHSMTLLEGTPYA